MGYWSAICLRIFLSTKIIIKGKENLIKKRPYVIVGAFILGMLLTPPDVISQVLLAIPIWILYELGIFFSTFVSKPKQLEVDEELVDDVSTSSKKDIIDKKDGE